MLVKFENMLDRHLDKLPYDPISDSKGIMESTDSPVFEIQWHGSTEKVHNLAFGSIKWKVDLMKLLNTAINGIFHLLK